MAKRDRRWDRAEREKYRGVRSFVDALREALRLEPLYGAMNMTRGSRKYGIARRFENQVYEAP